MPTLQHTFKKSGGLALGKISIRPVSPQFVDSGASLLLQEGVYGIAQDGTLLNSDGTSGVPLDPGFYVVTPLLDPPGSGSQNPYSIQMPASGGPYNLSQILTTSIPADAVQAISKAAADAAYLPKPVGATPGTLAVVGPGGNSLLYNGTSLAAPTNVRYPVDGVFHASGFGYVGDGVTGDAAAINAAMAACAAAGGGNVLVQGTVAMVGLIDACLIQPSGVELELGAGVTLRRKSGYNGQLIRNAADIPAITVTDGVTNGTTTLTSATANFTNALVGRAIGVAGANGGGSILYTTIASVTNATTVVLNKAALTSATGLTVNVYPARDTKIGLKFGRGAKIDGGSNSGSTGKANNHITYSRIDGLVIDNAHGISTLGKSFFYIRDVTDMQARGRSLFNVSSAGFQICGPMDGVVIENVRGTCYDDVVAFGLGDWTSQDETSGDISNVNIGVIAATSTIAAQLDLFGAKDSTCKMRGIRVGALRGTSQIGLEIQNMNEAPYGILDVDDVQIGSNSTACTAYMAYMSAGAAGPNIKLGDMTMTATPNNSGSQCAVVFTCPYVGMTVNMPRVEIASITYKNPLSALSNAVIIGNQPVTVGDVVIGSFNGPTPSAGAYAVVIQSATLNSLTINGGTWPLNASTLVFVKKVTSISTVNRITLRGFVIPSAPANSAVVSTADTSVVNYVNLEGCDFTGNAVNTLDVIKPQSAGSTIATVNVSRCNMKFLRMLYEGFTSQTTTSVVNISQTLIDTANRVVTAISAVTVNLGDGVTVANPPAAPFYASGGSIRVVGRLNRVNWGGNALFQRAASEAISANSGGDQGLACDVSTLTPTDGDVVYNSNASLGCGTGPAVYQAAAGKWKGLYSGVTN